VESKKFDTLVSEGNLTQALSCLETISAMMASLPHFDLANEEQSQNGSSEDTPKIYVAVKVRFVFKLYLWSNLIY